MDDIVDRLRLSVEDGCCCRKCNDLREAVVTIKALRLRINHQSEQIEELETRASTLDIAVSHWRYNHQKLSELYEQATSRG
jgi:hypothetical protein